MNRQTVREEELVVNTVSTVDEPSEIELMLGIIREIPDPNRQYAIARRMGEVLENEYKEIISRTARNAKN